MSGLSRFSTPGDVRGFYAQLGVDLPPRATKEAAVRCFANPDEHRRGDKRPSCSVSLTNGAFACHACGASGGAYDAALIFGRTPRQAIDLMVTFGLTERRTGPGNGSPPARRPRRPSTAAAAPSVPAVTEPQIAAWARALAEDRFLLRRLRSERGWAPDVLAAFGVGWDGRRVTLPVRDHRGVLQSVARYALPGSRSRTTPKLLAASGSRQLPFPSPAALPAPDLWVVEGHADALAVLSTGLPAVGVPGVWTWREGWATLFKDRHVVVCFDCDDEGREASGRVAADLVFQAASVRILDLDSDRHDGYDLTDEILALGDAAVPTLLRLAAALPACS